MKHASVRELYDYWNELRGRRAVPERSDIEPGAIRRILADTFILGFDARAGHPFRIAGTRVCAAFGHELKGEAFVNLWAAASRTPMRELLTVVAEESISVVAGVTARNTAGATVDLELLILPLGHPRRTLMRFLGALAAIETPDWLGTSTLEPLVLGTLRYLGPESIEEPVPPLVSAVRGGRIRHGFMVYDGGQS